MGTEQWYALPMNHAIQERLNKCGVVWIPTSGIFYEDDSADVIVYEGMVATFPLSAREGIEECLQHSFDYEEDSVYMHGTLGVHLLTTDFVLVPLAATAPALAVPTPKVSVGGVTKPTRLRRKRGNKISYSSSTEIRWNRSMADTIMQKYADDWGMDIKVTCPHGSTTTPAQYNAEAMSVIIYSGPTGMADKGRSEVRLQDRKQTVVADCFIIKPSTITPMSIPIYDEVGKVIAILANKSNLYISNDLCHYADYEDQYTVLAYIFAEVDKIIKSGFNCSEANAALHKAIVDMMQKSLSGLTDQYKAAINEAERRYKDHMRIALDEENKRRDNLRLLASFDIDKLKGKAEATVKNILATKGVAGIVQDGRYIKITTSPLSIKAGEDMYYVGRFSIHIDPSSGELPYINSLDGFGGHTHPHIRSTSVCWGNIGDGILKLIASKDFDIALQLVLQYLCTVYPPDTYYPITDWPLLSKCSQQEQEEAVYVG